MGLSSKKTKTKSTETLAPNPVYAPQIDAAGAQLRPAFDDAQANVRSIMPRINQGLDYYGDVLGGQYLERGNPHLEGVIEDTNQSISDGVNTQFSGAGRYGSGSHAKVLADRIAANENALRFGSYAQERGYQNDAARGVGSLGTISAALPQLPSNQFADAISQLYSRYVTGSGQSTTTEKKGIGLLMMEAAAAAAQAAAASGSDRRLKENIVKIGEESDGLGVYEFDYRQDTGLDLPTERQLGVMADEVAVLRPWALGPELPGGFGSVYYGRL